MNIFDPKQLALLQSDPDENASLQTLLTKHSLSLLELLSIKNIQPKIRSNFNLFIKYCQKNEDFCFHLIDIGIKCPMHEGANDNMKQACYIAADVLTCDQDVVAQLLILPDKSKPKRKESANDSDQFEEIQENIETEVSDGNKFEEADAQEEQLTEQQIFHNKYKYLTRLLDYISTSETKNLDQNCINYMIKALNCLVRKKALEFLDFFDKKPQVFKKLIELSNFSSISQFLIKILSDDENQGNKIDTVKREIIKGVWQKFMDSISQEDFLERLDFLEELFQTNKYASDDDRTDLQKLSDVFASQETIQFFHKFLLDPKTPTQFSNAVSYLVSIVKRMNIDEEADPYSYSNEPRQQTMVFKVDVLYKQFGNILTKGYENLLNLKYPEPYVNNFQYQKQKMVETKFYELLVLLSKNSRFANCFEGTFKVKDTILIGNNIIFSNRDAKTNALRQLLKQFTKQTKSGINRISLISLIQKILLMQVYEPQNHLIQKDDSTLAKNPNSNQLKPSDQQTKNLNSQNNSPTKQQQFTPQDDDLADGQDKKSKINKIKAGLKLNIKKFSLDSNESAQKQEEKKEPELKKTHEPDNVKRHQSNLTQSEVISILKYFAETLNTESGTLASDSKKKQKNSETQVGALINKLLMIFLNSIEWPQVNEEKLILEKQNLIGEIQNLFPYFNFSQICKNYSVTLATTKHPNASAKEKTNPELTFTNQFFRIYQTKKEESPGREKQKTQKSLEFSDSDFKSDEEEVQAVKCSIEDFKKFTGFTFEAKNPVKEESEVQKVTEVPKKQQTPQIPQIPKVQSVDQKIQSPQKKELVKQKQKSRELIEQKDQSPVKVSLSPQKPVEEKKESKGIELKVVKEEVKQKKIPFEFYIKHQVILV